MDFMSQTCNFSFWFVSTAHVLVVLRLQRAIRVVRIKGPFFSFLQFSQRFCLQIGKGDVSVTYNHIHKIDDIFVVVHKRHIRITTTVQLWIYLFNGALIKRFCSIV